ncbi:hypothetical protein JCM15519_28200 [Fundidesulfovibrio butyratiphilus]
MDFRFVIGCCWFRERDMRELGDMLRERPEIGSCPDVGSIDLERFDPGTFSKSGYDKIFYGNFSLSSMRHASRKSREAPLITTIAEPMAHAGFGLENITEFGAREVRDACLRLLGPSVRAFLDAAPPADTVYPLNPDVEKGGVPGRPRHLVLFLGNYLLAGSSKAAVPYLLGQRKRDTHVHTRHCSFEEALDLLDSLAKDRDQFGRIKAVIGTDCPPESQGWADQKARVDAVAASLAGRDMDVELFDVSALYLFPLADMLTYKIRGRLIGLDR